MTPSPGPTAPSSRPLRIKLVSPRMSLRPMDSEFKRLMSPPLTLVTLATLTPAPHSVRIEDENLGPLDLGDTPDLVGITVNIDTADRAFEISRTYRERGIPVVFGGIHASAVPDEMAPHCDAVCIGEAENLWPGILEDVGRGELRARYFDPDPVDLSRVPLPDWSRVERSRYLYDNIVVASRGCPFRCEFCYNSCDYVKNVYRHRPVEDLLREIRALGTRQVMFIDDNLIGNLPWFETFVEAMRPLDLVWHGAVSTNIVHHPDLVQRMARAGCRSLFVGFESIDPRSLRSVGKVQNRISDYERLVATLHGNGIMVNASLVFGFDHDTPEIFPATLDWLVRNRIESMTGHILTPYPGTVLHRRLSEEGRIVEHDRRKYNTSHVVFRPARMTAEELREGYLWIYDRFYSLGNIVRRRPADPRRLAPYLAFNLGYRKFGRATAWLGRFGWMRRLGRFGRKLAYGID